MNENIHCPVCQQLNEAQATECVQCKANIAQSQMIAALSARLGQLEQVVANLQGDVVRVGQVSAETPQPTPTITKADRQQQWHETTSQESQQPEPESTSRITASDLLSGEFWLDKAGIGLTILALALLFRLAIDRGWITPVVRVGIGFVLSTLLMGGGFWMFEKRPKLSKALLGGGLVAYYVTGFAAFQLYDLVAYPIAFGYMLLITTAGYALALQQDDSLLSLIAATGGLATPFLLYTDSGSVTGLVVYTCLILLTIGAIYFWRGWKLLLWTGVIGSFLIFSTAISAHDSSEQWVVQLGVTGWFALAWLLPVIRSVFHQRRPLRWKASTFGIANETMAGIFNRDVHLLTLTTPFTFIFFSGLLWLFDLEKEAAGAWILLLTGGFGAMAFWLTQQKSVLRDIHLFTTILLFTLSLLLLFEGEWLFVVILAEILGLHLAAMRSQLKWLRIFAHVATFGIVSVLLFRIAMVDVTIWATALDLVAIIAIGALGLAMGRSAEKRTYQLAAYTMFLAFILAQCLEFTNGQAIISILWGATAIILLVWSVWQQQIFARQVALGTLFIIVGKLLLVDFAEVDAVYRILLFFGFGVLFLVLSYGLWRRPNSVT